MRHSCEIAVVLACSAGCTADEFADLSGVYRVDSDVASSPCGTDQPVAQPWPFVKLVASNTLGGYWWQRCSDMAATNCSGNQFRDAFPEPTDDGWIGEITGTEGAGTCVLLYALQAARLDGAHLTIELEEHREEALPSACTVAEAQFRNTVMPCTTHERYDATRL